MGYTAAVLDSVRRQLAPSKEAMTEARDRRRRLVKDAAIGFPGSLRVFDSGSLAHATANCPIHRRDQGLDADCGVVLDRRRYTELGPDGYGVGPDDIVKEMRDEIAGKVRAEYPNATLKITKRAILIEFNSPLSTGEDPSVDLVVCLDRRQAPGLWIPNTEQHRWDQSDPEQHTRLLTADPKSLRVTRARAIRLAKAENKREDKVPLCSFNLEAFGLMFVDTPGDEPSALLAIWEDGAADLKRRLTPDPAGVSKPIKVADVDYAVLRLEQSAMHLCAALEHDDDLTRVRTELRHLWPEFIPSAESTSSQAEILAGLKAGATIGVTSTGGLSTSAGAQIKNPRSYGDPRP